MTSDTAHGKTAFAFLFIKGRKEGKQIPNHNARLEFKQRCIAMPGLENVQVSSSGLFVCT